VKSGSEHETSEQSAWEQWLVERVPVLLLFARQQTRCEADAQDVLQEATLECWRRRPSGQPPAQALVFATIRRRAIDLARSNDRRTHRESVVLDQTPQTWFDASVEEREHSRLLHQAMTSLPDMYREVITLKVWGGLTFEEVAEALDIPANTAASRYRYGLEQLRTLTREIFA
jgi:RNA polymerase sigma-70 factor (ECF subfamily)